LAVDRLRGLAMVLMALDHVRLFMYPSFGMGLSEPGVSLAYYTVRWISHLCAPIFVVLAGVSAWLYQRNHSLSTRQLTGYLVRRGVWLILLELTVVNLAWNLGWRGYWNLQVLWAIGWAMICLALLVHCKPRTVGLIGAAIVAGHNALDVVHSADLGRFAPLWGLLHEPVWILLTGGSAIRVQYPLLPWIGIIALGYAVAPVILIPRAERHVLLLRSALTAVSVFFALRYANFYGDPRPWRLQERGFVSTIMAFLDIEKYPPSLLFILITLGLALLLLVALDLPVGRHKGVLHAFGRVPLFFYVVHLPLAHLIVRLYVHWASAVQSAPGDIDYLALFGLCGLLLFVLFFACRAYAQAWAHWTAAA
jgi:uncharacterized membrane protein